MSEENRTSVACSVCGKGGASKRCGRCRSVCYCGQECQKQDWNAHKKQCFAPDSSCARCLRTNIAPNTVCRVPHPEHLLEDAGSSFGGGGTTLSFFCRACDKTFSKSAPGIVAADSDPQWTYEPPSAHWCYQGPHMIKPVPVHDHRRVDTEIVAIAATSDVQSKIDALADTDVRILTIKTPGGCYDDTVKPVLALRLPKLEKLVLIDVCFDRVTLTPELTPNLEDIEMQNIPEECDIQVTCRSLSNFDMRYYHGDCQWLDTMLIQATKLTTFRSYKLGVSSISFASNALTEIHLHRSDCLGQVSLWAPRLQYLRLQGCYSLDSIVILDDHPLSKELSPTFRKTSFRVETTNSCLSPQVISTLNSHPRVEWEGEEDDETAGVGGSGMETLFANMHRGMGF